MYSSLLMYSHQARVVIVEIVIACLFRVVIGQTDPTSIACSSLSSTSLQVTWIQATDASVQGYFLDATRSDGLKDEPFSSIQLTSPTYQTQTFSGLGEYGEYNLTIHSYTSSANLTTYTVVCRTDEAFPDGAPLSLTCEGTGYTYIDCTWDTIDPIHINGILVGYTIQWMSLNNSLMYSNTSSTESYQVTGLAYDTKYIILVNGYTSVGQGLVYTSDIAKTKSLYDTVTENVTKHYCYEMVPGYIEFSWDEMPCTIYAGTIGALFLMVTMFTCVCACQACCRKGGSNSNFQINMSTAKEQEDSEPDSSEDEQDRFDETGAHSGQNEEEDMDSDRVSNPDDDRGSALDSRLSNHGEGGDDNTPNAKPNSETKREKRGKIANLEVDFSEESEECSDSDYDTFDEEDVVSGASAHRLPPIRKLVSHNGSNAVTKAVVSNHIENETAGVQNKEVAIGVVAVESERNDKANRNQGTARTAKPKTTGNIMKKKKRKVEMSMNNLFSPISENSSINEIENADTWEETQFDDGTNIIIPTKGVTVLPLTSDESTNNVGIGDWSDGEGASSKNTARLQCPSTAGFQRANPVQTLGDWDNVEGEASKIRTKMEVASAAGKQTTNQDQILGDWDDVEEEQHTSTQNKTTKQTPTAEVRMHKENSFGSLGGWSDGEEEQLYFSQYKATNKTPTTNTRMHKEHSVETLGEWGDIDADQYQLASPKCNQRESDGVEGRTEQTGNIPNNQNIARKCQAKTINNTPRKTVRKAGVPKKKTGNGPIPNMDNNTFLKQATPGTGQSVHFDNIENVNLVDERNSRSAQEQRALSPRTSAWVRRKSVEVSSKTRTRTPVRTFQSDRYPIKEPEPVLGFDRLGKKFPFLSPEQGAEIEPRPVKRNIRKNGWTSTSQNEQEKQSNVPDKFTFKKTQNAFSESDVEGSYKKSEGGHKNGEGGHKKSEGGQVFYGFGVGKFRQYAANWINKLRRKRPTQTVDAEWG